MEVETLLPPRSLPPVKEEAMVEDPGAQRHPEHILPPPSPSNPLGEEDEEEEMEDGSDLQEFQVLDTEVQENGSGSEHTKSPNPNLDQQEDVSDHPALKCTHKLDIDRMTSILQSIEDDGLIPSESLEDMDHSSVVYALGTKYNCALRKYQVQKETLMKKYNQEYAERKRLYNELMEMKGNIRVFCRCRPLNSVEVSKGYSSVFNFDPSQERELQILSSDTSKKHFKFDRVFGTQDNQETIFAETSPIVRSVLDGYNACIFAYGQTGTGKTFTMEGTEEDRGVNYRTLEEIFRLSRERGSTMRYEFHVSMLEVYNEKIRDLLESSNHQEKKLDIKQAAEGTQEVPGLTEAPASTTEEVWALLGTGQKNRSVGSTNANEMSSRSHCLLRVTVKAENLLNGQKSRSHLWLVDLAGSERVGKIDVEGERLKESQFINKSLSALGDVISALASKNHHIPYRNSKLTHLLQSSLGGDCKTLMIVQISPSSSDVGETLCSLNFATRVQGVEHGPARKQQDVESFKFKQMAEKLRQEEKENAKLNDNLQLMYIKYASRESVIKNLQEKVRELESQQQQQLYDARKAKIQPEGKGSSRIRRPPLPPVKEQRRQPLRKITNVLPPPRPRGFRRNSIANPLSSRDKENKEKNHVAADGPPPPLSLVKATRVPAPLRRRVSVAALPSQTAYLRSSDGEKKVLPPPPSSSQGASLFLSFKRRLSSTPLSTLPPMTPLAASTPGRRKGRTWFDGNASSSKYLSPPQAQLQRQPQVSKIPTYASSRRRLRLVASPKNAPSQGSKLCFSVQKRVVIGSPARLQRPPMLSGMASTNNHHIGLPEEEIIRPRRVLSNTGRMSIS